VVGRLVEQQEVGARQQQAAQRHAATLAARQHVTSASSGGQRSASMAISTLRSRLHASVAAILSSSIACSLPILS
jgi:hypothetical protein